MGKLTLGQKAQRVLKLLLGMRHAKVAALLATRGFGPDDVDEGWALLRATSRTKYDDMSQVTADPNVVTRLDEWENTWFPVIQATLERRFPAVAEKVFLNLTQTAGIEVILSVSILVDRIAELSTTTDDESRWAWELLNKRGLTAEVMEQVRGLLKSVQRAEEGTMVDLAAQRESVERAETELWNWYLEWSRIARAVITDRALLRKIGFLKSKVTNKGENEDEEVDDEGEEDEPSVPTGTSVSGYAPAMSSQVSVKVS
jgi:hypothetical protein